MLPSPRLQRVDDGSKGRSLLAIKMQGAKPTAIDDPEHELRLLLERRDRETRAKMIVSGRGKTRRNKKGGKTSGTRRAPNTQV